MKNQSIFSVWVSQVPVRFYLEIQTEMFKYGPKVPQEKLHT